MPGDREYTTEEVNDLVRTVAVMGKSVCDLVELAKKHEATLYGDDENPGLRTDVRGLIAWKRDTEAMFNRWVYPLAIGFLLFLAGFIGFLLVVGTPLEQMIFHRGG